jgi:accessory gene regulator protein AgrB
MADKKPVVAFSPEDMKRRKMRAIVMALVLVGLVVLFFVTTIFKIKAGIQ